MQNVYEAPRIEQIIEVGHLDQEIAYAGIITSPKD